MKLRHLAALSTLLASPFTLAQTPTKLCQSSLFQDQQADFDANTLSASSAIQVTGTPAVLRLDTNRTPLDPEKIVFPFQQRVSVDYIYESGGASVTLGWLYYDELINRGYVNTQGTPDTGDDTLVDSNGNGLDDFHEDMYNLAPIAGASARPYVGRLRRCGTGFTAADGQAFTEPEIATRSCAATYVPSVNLGDSRPGAAANGNLNTLLPAATVGQLTNAVAMTATEFSDNGLFPHVPNLLEPRDSANDSKGLGHIVFLISDDDTDNTTFSMLPPLADTDTLFDGTPDYDVSAFDANGRAVPAAANPNPGITSYDRRVDLGQVDGQREVVFFVISYYDAIHATTTPNTLTTVYPCLRYRGDGTCSLYLKTPISVFFSKAFLNLDQNFKQGTPSASVNIGCAYNNLGPPSAGCPTTTVNGWLDAAALTRLSTNYGLVMPNSQVVTINRPANNLMPHALVGAPSNDLFAWIIGFEDLNGGGDRDFNDVVFKINKLNGGEGRSGIVSGDISPTIAEDFTITRIRFARRDDASENSWFEEPGHPGACAMTPLPAINYAVAIDCKLCSGGVCSQNPSPTWIPITFPETTPPTREVTLDLLSLGFTGSQLCWKVNMVSPNEFCRPTIYDVQVGYDAMRAGDFARGAPTPIGNGILYATYETPGRQLFPAPSVRAYDGRKDYAFRGHLYFKSLYDPEDTATTRVVQRWDLGRALSDYIASSSPQSRKLYTSDASGNRLDVAADLADSSPASQLFPDAKCSVLNGARYPFDLNGDGFCYTDATAPAAPSVQANDRRFFKEWLFGWEDQYDVPPAGPVGANKKRAWVMGGVNQSTPALVGPPGYPEWYLNTDGLEQAFYKNNFLTPLSTRDTYAFVGTMSGALEASLAGKFRLGDDACTSAKEARGYFERNAPASCAAPGIIPTRQYGTGAEAFAYLPRGLLDGYLSHYVSYTTAGFTPGPRVDASPSFANIDLGNVPGKDPWTVDPAADPRRGAKTVLVSATGPNSDTVFALDVTDPSSPAWPRPLFEYKLSNVSSDFGTARAADSTVLLPDTLGSRHAAPIGRMELGGADGDKWVTLIATDYVTNSNAAGAVYFLDLSTGQPLQLKDSSGTLLPNAGVVTLEDMFGIAGSPTIVDADSNGRYDTVYVPTVSGKVWRINTKAARGTKLGRIISACVVANLQADLAMIPGSEPTKQKLYSSLAVTTVGSPSQLKVRFYAGTADSPDDPSDPVAANYFVLGYEDATPLGDCNGTTVLWGSGAFKLPAGHRVWGGVTLSAGTGTDQGGVMVTTAVGGAADACSLSETENGKLYVLGQNDGSQLVAATDLGGHAISPPVVYDEHLFVLRPDGKVTMKGGNTWNNPPANAAQQGSRVLIWDNPPGGAMPR